MRKLPLLPTILVALAALTMIGLGIWQLQRKAQKDALLASYAAAQKLPPISYPTMPVSEPLPLFRAATGNCLRPATFRTAAGSNWRGESGFLVIADCITGAEGPGMAVEIGWTKDPNAGKDWRGGLVSGVIAPDSQQRMRLVAASPAPGLDASAEPSPDTIPNNHMSYAIQWFLFAGLALLIYGLALRGKRQAKADG